MELKTKKQRPFVTEKFSVVLIAIGASVLGGFIALFCLDLGEKASTHLANLGTIIGGIVGSIWSLAGVILFYIGLQKQSEDLKINNETLDLQRQELKLQRDELENTRKVFTEQSLTLKLQQREATYFNLLENHRSLVMGLSEGKEKGYSLLESIYIQAKSSFLNYKKALADGEANPSTALLSPFIFMKNNGELLVQVTNDIVNIIDFVNHEMNNNLFYHRTLYNTLSAPEKFFFGMLCCLNPNQDDFNRAISSSSFDYLIYYKNSESFYDSKEGSLPLLGKKFSKNISWKINKDRHREFPRIQIDSYDIVDVLIRKYVFRFNPYESSEIGTYDFDLNRKIGFGESIEIDFYSLLRDEYLQSISLIIKNGRGGEIDFRETYKNISFELELSYQGKEILYYMNFEIKIQNAAHSDPFVDFLWR